MRWPRPESLRYGARLAGAVLLAFAASTALHLPEGFWAVMSALIVVRPDTGSTLGAGWDRIRGALVGTALGLAGAAWRHACGGVDFAPLVLVTLLSFAAGLSPTMRSAPISALIVVTSGGISGHSAAEVALLRALEIGLGIAAALLVSLVDLRSRATLRFRAAAATHLRALADALVAVAPIAQEDADAERRAALRQLAVLADAADREARVLGRRATRAGAERHRKSARLLSRIASDTALFARLRPATSANANDAPSATAPIEQHAAERLREVASELAGQRPAGAAATVPADQDHGSAGDVRIAMRLLGDDLDALMRLEKLQPADPARGLP
jgi:uncharacterized membrane protein YccC